MQLPVEIDPRPSKQGAGAAKRHPAADRLRDLFATWEADDATDDPEELDRRDEEWSAFQRQLDEGRQSTRTLFPRSSQQDRPDPGPHEMLNPHELA